MYAGRKRARDDGGAKRRYAAARAINAKWPLSRYGQAHFLRGDPDNVERFGSSFRSANAEQVGNRRQFGYYGRGAYRSMNYVPRGRGAYWGEALGRYAGGALGSIAGGFMGGQPGAYLGANAGRALGGALGDRASDYVMNKISGRGEYLTNTLVNPTGTLRPVSNTIAKETGDIVFSHTEYIQDVVPTSAAFQTQYFNPINPGLSTFAPWLSQIAQYFEEYELVQCIYEFRSMVTSGNTTSAGTVIMATQYNPLNPPFTIKGNMENYDFANSVKVTDSAFHGVECDPKLRAGSACEYIRTGPVPTGQDAKTYDLGVFQLATSGAQPGLMIGELHIKYTVRLSKSKVVLAGANSSPNGLAYQVSFPYAAQVGNLPNSLSNPGNVLGLTPQNVQYLAADIPAFLASVGSVPPGLTTFDNSGEVLLSQTGTNTTTLTLPAWVNGGTFVLYVKWFDSTIADASELDLPFSFTGTMIDSIYSPAQADGQNLNVSAVDACWGVVFFNVNSPQGVSSTVSWTMQPTFPGAAGSGDEVMATISLYQVALNSQPSGSFNWT